MYKSKDLWTGAHLTGSSDESRWVSRDAAIDEYWLIQLPMDESPPGILVKPRTGDGVVFQKIGRFNRQGKVIQSQAEILAGRENRQSANSQKNISMGPRL